jgi:hypothetical protein
MNEVEYQPYSYGKDLLLHCSLGLNIGFLIGMLFI